MACVAGCVGGVLEDARVRMACVGAEGEGEARVGSDARARKEGGRLRWRQRRVVLGGYKNLGG